MNTHNLILNVDSYKASHYLQYPPGTQYVSSYVESRGGPFDASLFFGLQAFIKEYLLRPITANDIAEAESLLREHGVPFNRAGWEYILRVHRGHLPLLIEAAPEGTLIPTSNVMLQVTNTDSNCEWLTSYIETALLRAIWYPTTVATISHAARQVIGRYLAETADSTDSLPFKLHDFGARGVSSLESAALGGLAHLVNFHGTDTVSALIAARRYYGEHMAGFSIPAAEHSTMTAWGKDREAQAYENMLNRFSGPNQMVAVVSDSYDLWNALENIWGDQLREKVQDNGGTVVIRPDSGDPEKVVVRTLEILMDRFGHQQTHSGYRLLPDYIRVIQGDGVNLESIAAILEAMKQKGLSADNVAFGMGGALLQKLNRDTLRFAMKANAICIDNQWSDIWKDPVTDSGKRSKRGRLALVKEENSYATVRLEELGDAKNQLRPVYRNGELLVDDSFSQVRQRAEVTR